MRNNLHCQVRAGKWQQQEDGCTSKLMVSRASAFPFKSFSIVLPHSPTRTTEKQYTMSGIEPRPLTLGEKKENSLWQAQMGLHGSKALGSLYQSLATLFQCTSVNGWDTFPWPSPRELSHSATALVGYR